MGKQWKLTDFNFLGSKITADGDCSHEIQRCLLLGRKAMTNLDSILKNREITLPTNVQIVKAMAYPVVMCRCNSSTIKRTAHQRVYAFEIGCWRRLLRVIWTARRRRGVRASGPSQGRTGESGAFGLLPHPRGSSRISS